MIVEMLKDNGFTKTIVVLAGHGSRDPAANQDFTALVAAYSSRHPKSLITYGYIEQTKPSLQQALYQAASGLPQEKDRLVIMPILLFYGGHAKRDMPLALDAVRKDFPRLHFVLGDVLGVHPNLARLAYKRLCQTRLFTHSSAVQSALIYVGRGFQNQETQKDFQKQADLFFDRCSGFDNFWTCYAGLHGPYLPETLNLAIQSKAKQIIIVPHLLFRGILIHRMQAELTAFAERFPETQIELAPPLGIDELLLRVLDERIKELLYKNSVLGS